MSKEQDVESNIPKSFPPVVPDIREWPIYKMAKDREKLIDVVVKRTEDELFEHLSKGNGLLRNIADIYYQERVRLQENPWKVDPKDDPAFWKRVRNKLQRLAQPGHEDPEAVRALLHEIVERYTREVAGDFKEGTYNFARKFINFGFSRVFNAAQQGLFRGFRKQRMQLQEKMQLVGETEKLRELTKLGTVILVPTHFSNLDSIVIGWAIETLGLPAFTYGAGINLFGHPILAYFMSRLGAFRVDRRKKNKAYLTVLKSYSEEVLLRKGHMLFFPGGTRSRSGSLESRFKLGLLGTAIETQRKLLLEGNDNDHKIFIVPLVISYHSVLEGRGLIDEFLRQEGKEQFVLLQDDSESIRKNLSFAWKFFKSSSEMVFSVGEAMDLFGNKLDDEGNSIDKYGRVLDLRDYFRSNGNETNDPQRSHEYTRLLGQQLLERFQIENVVFSSHLVAFAAWQILLREKNGDIYRLLNVPEEDLFIPREEMLKTVDRLHVRLRELERNGRLRLAQHMHTDIRAIIEHGLKNIGVYHINQPLLRGKKGELLTQDLRLLYFYSNRLKGFDLEKYV
ncbi:MAG: 1-acyl-sn-glycerol-3-phosphate acyltransferase [Bacteroidetes bacterium]|nr:1-acyl-sn-glycerol-3-phosphate acyltransferase [Bacteroidota bacterium]